MCAMKRFTGADLAKMRAERGLTRAKLGAELGISRNSVLHYEQAKEADVPRVVRLALTAWDHGLEPIWRAPGASHGA